jgi:hypothetical protein
MQKKNRERCPKRKKNLSLSRPRQKTMNEYLAFVAIALMIGGIAGIWILGVKQMRHHDSLTIWVMLFFMTWISACMCDVMSRLSKC